MNPLHPKMLCAMFGRIWFAEWFWRRSLNIIFLFRYYLPLEKGRGPSYEQTCIPSIKGCFVLFLVGPMVLEKKIFEYFQYNFTFSLLSPLGEERGLSFQLESPSPKDALCQILLFCSQWFWRRRFLNIFNRNLIFYFISPCWRAWAFVSTNLNSLYEKMLCAKLGWNKPSSTGEEDF